MTENKSNRPCATCLFCYHSQNDGSKSCVLLRAYRQKDDGSWVNRIVLSKPECLLKAPCDDHITKQEYQELKSRYFSRLP